MSIRVKLNIGGIKYETTKDVLSSEIGSLFTDIFTNHQKITQDKKGYYFFDRDGKFFIHILNYLNTKQLNISNENTYLIDELYKEAQYFRLNSMINLLLELRSRNLVTNLTLIEITHFSNFKNLQAPNIKLCGLIIRNLSLRKANFQGSDFSNTVFIDVDFTEALLSGTNFYKVNSRGAIFTGALLRKASFVEAYLCGNFMNKAVCCEANFTQANMGCINLRDSDLQSANFSNANLLVANLENANLLLTNLKGTILDGANIKGAKGISYALI